MKTRLTEMLGIQHPIVMGGMTGVGTPELAAAVSQAGALGIFCAHNCNGGGEDLRVWIKKCRAMCDGKPFGVNLTFLPSMRPPPYDEYCKVMIEEKVPVAETAGGPLAFKYVKTLKSAGLTVIHKCTSIKHCQKAESEGVDILSVDGYECAGHPGPYDVGGLVLLSMAAKHLKKPYIASGGIGDGKQLAACIALGADGVNLGSRICITKENVTWPQSFMDRALKAEAKDTAVVLKALGNPARVFGNKVAREVERIGVEKGNNLQFEDVAHLMAGGRGRQAEQDGDADGGIWSLGQVVGLIDDIPTVQELIDGFMAEAVDTISARMISVIPPAKL